ncbi:MAG TPA: PRC-barrel domain-containing protein [Candidatus Limnocylindria bacterium]|nr:PRC-barrel domain-containing protein [Candidatus Limnocylindria bacterium]
MEHTTYASRLRYLDAEDVDATVVDYDGLDVCGPDGTRIGDLDGFLVDAEACRVRYVVVDSGGWFRSRRVLIPVGHATIGSERKTLRVEVTRDALSRYPPFDEDRFREFSDEDMRLFERSIRDACCPDKAPGDEAAAYDTHPHFAQPEWWVSGSYPQERLLPVETGVYRSGTIRERFGAPPQPVEASDAPRPVRTAQRILFDDEEPRQSER